MDQAGPILCIEDRGTALALFSEGGDLSEWMGAPLDEIRGHFPSRVVITIPQSTMDSSILESLGQAHLDAQVEGWRSTVVDQGAIFGVSKKSGKKAESNGSDQELVERHLQRRRHFLLDALKDSWWTKVLPSAFGIFLRLEGGNAPKDFLLVYRKGKLEQFGAPDLTFLSSDRRKDSADVVKYLADRFMLPVQGVLVREEDWNLWSEQPSPWREIAWGVQSSRVQLVPLRWGVLSILATRGMLGF